MRSRNIVAFVAVAIATYLVRLYGGAAWNKEFLLNRSFDVGFSWYFYTWGFELLLLFCAGALLTILVRSRRRIYWAISLGVALSLLRIVTARWTIYESDAETFFWMFGWYLMPAVGATLGALLVAGITKRTGFFV